MPLSTLQKKVRKDLTINAGDSFTQPFAFKQGGSAVDISTYTAEAFIVDKATGDEKATFDVDTSDTVNGVITISLTTTQTEALADCDCNLRWYFRVINTVTPETDSHTLFVGDVEINEEDDFPDG